MFHAIYLLFVVPAIRNNAIYGEVKSGFMDYIVVPEQSLSIIFNPG